MGNMEMCVTWQTRVTWENLGDVVDLTNMGNVGNMGNMEEGITWETCNTGSMGNMRNMGQRTLDDAQLNVGCINK